jgi:hypothetical protein
MQDYVGKETADKLFKNIQSIKVTISENELKKILPLMKGFGYSRKGNKFFHEESPEVIGTPLKENKRVTIIHIKLTQHVQKRMIRISNNGYLLLNGFDAFFNYSVASPNN